MGVSMRELWRDSKLVDWGSSGERARMYVGVNKGDCPVDFIWVMSA
jgi:hypothetical protein